jgi:2-oxoisovalerate dehydrogenase E2 component (dihydrolipoyl transacylase)
MNTFNLPDLGEGLQEAELVAWHVGEGDHIVVDQPLVSVETEKAVVEIPSPQSGYVARLLARPGERVKVGAPLLAFEQGPHLETGTVVGELAKPAPTAEPAKTAPRAAPAIRSYAKEVGVDLSNVKGSGPQGAITRADVEVAASSTDALRGARRTMALNMARAWREVAHATLIDQADVTSWTAREDVTGRLIRAIVAACAAEPALNATFDGASLSLHRNQCIDLGLAIDSPDGLFVPVLRDVGANSTAWRAQIDAAKAAIASRSLPPAELRGATITLSNFGTLAGQHAALIVMPPQVAIVGAGRIKSDRMLPISLTFDHRAITGGEAARFMSALLTDLERPA